jgi:hypothetical protein
MILSIILSIILVASILLFGYSMRRVGEITAELRILTAARDWLNATDVVDPEIKRQDVRLLGMMMILIGKNPIPELDELMAMKTDEEAEAEQAEVPVKVL